MGGLGSLANDRFTATILASRVPGFGRTEFQRLTLEAGRSSWRDDLVFVFDRPTGRGPVTGQASGGRALATVLKCLGKLILFRVSVGRIVAGMR